MKTVVSAKNYTLLSLKHQELVSVYNCLNELLNSSDITSEDCETRIGMKLNALRELLSSFSAAVDNSGRDEFERFEAWKEGESIQIIAISAAGDPADLSYDEVRQTIHALQIE